MEEIAEANFAQYHGQRSFVGRRRTQRKVGKVGREWGETIFDEVSNRRGRRRAVAVGCWRAIGEIPFSANAVSKYGSYTAFIGQGHSWRLAAQRGG